MTALNCGQPRTFLMARRFQKPSGASAPTTSLSPYLQGQEERSLAQPKLCHTQSFKVMLRSSLDSHLQLSLAKQKQAA